MMTGSISTPSMYALYSQRVVVETFCVKTRHFPRPDAGHIALFRTARRVGEHDLQVLETRAGEPLDHHRMELVRTDSHEPRGP